MQVPHDQEPTAKDYALLHITPKATDIELGKAYRAAAKGSHPDAFPNGDGDSTQFDACTQSYDRIVAFRLRYPEVAHISLDGITIFSLPMSTASFWTTAASILIGPDRVCYINTSALCYPAAIANATVRVERDTSGYHVCLPCANGQRWPIHVNAARIGIEVMSANLWLFDEKSSGMEKQFIGSAGIRCSSPARIPQSFLQRSTRQHNRSL